MNMNNDTDHSVALQALGWKPLKTERKKGKANVYFSTRPSWKSASVDGVSVFK